MVDYREILRLKSLNYSQTDIAASVHSSRNTIQEVLSIARALQIQWPLDDDVTNPDWNLFFIRTDTKRMKNA